MLSITSRLPLSIFFFFFFNDTATTEIYTLPLHDALPILIRFDPEPAEIACVRHAGGGDIIFLSGIQCRQRIMQKRSEEHTSELQSPCNLVCRLLLEKKKKINIKI